MLIRLLPSSTAPSILFSLAPPQPPNYLPLPSHYSNTLHTLVEHGLEVPTTMASVDRGSWAMGLMDEVCFDLIGKGKITVGWIDGLVEEWDMTMGCRDMLMGVINLVRNSELEACRESREREMAAAAAATALAFSNGGHLNPPAEGKKQKKQRNLIMNLVASVLSPPSSPSATSPPIFSLPPPPPSPSPPSLPSNTVPHSRRLRRKARSLLLDTFRRHVVAPLSLRFRCPANSGLPGHGYIEWVTRSMLRRCGERISELIRAQQQDELDDGNSNAASPTGTGSTEDTSTSEEDTRSDSTASSGVLKTPNGSSVTLPLPLSISPPRSIVPQLQVLHIRLNNLLTTLHTLTTAAHERREEHMITLEQRVRRRYHMNPPGTKADVEGYEPSLLAFELEFVDEDEGEDGEGRDTAAGVEEEEEEEIFRYPIPSPPPYAQAPLLVRGGGYSPLARQVLINRSSSFAFDFGGDNGGNGEPFDSFPLPVMSSPRPMTALPRYRPHVPNGWDEEDDEDEEAREEEGVAELGPFMNPVYEVVNDLPVPVDEGVQVPLPPLGDVEGEQGKPVVEEVGNDKVEVESPPRPSSPSPMSRPPVPFSAITSDPETEVEHLTAEMLFPTTDDEEAEGGECVLERVVTSDPVTNEKNVIPFPTIIMPTPALAQGMMVFPSFEEKMLPVDIPVAVVGVDVEVAA